MTLDVQNRIDEVVRGDAERGRTNEYLLKQRLFAEIEANALHACYSLIKRTLHRDI